MIKKKRNFTNLMYITFIAVLILLIDQFTKFWVVRFLQQTHNHMYYVNQFFNLILVYNHGVSFGFLSTLYIPPYYFALLSMIIICMMCIWYMAQERQLYITLAIAMIVGGALSNVVDRFTFNAVVDFLDLHISHHHYPAFNIADMAVVTGIVLFVVNDFLLYKTHPRQ